MSLLRTPWFSTVELFVPNAPGNRVNFQDQPQLTTLIDQQINILAVELFTADSLAVAPSGQAMASITELRKMMLTLVNDDMQRIYQYPVTALIRQRPGTNNQPNSYDLQLFDRLTKISWTKCYIEYATAAGAGPYSVVFGVHYDKLEGEYIK